MTILVPGFDDPVESLLVIAGCLLAFSVYDTLLHRMWRAVMRRRG
jgi:hypothetical protein